MESRLTVLSIRVRLLLVRVMMPRRRSPRMWRNAWRYFETHKSSILASLSQASCSILGRCDRRSLLPAMRDLSSSPSLKWARRENSLLISSHERSVLVGDFCRVAVAVSDEDDEDEDDEDEELYVCCFSSAWLSRDCCDQSKLSRSSNSRLRRSSALRPTGEGYFFKKQGGWHAPKLFSEKKVSRWRFIILGGEMRNRQHSSL